jgi:hypothetical protein
MEGKLLFFVSENKYPAINGAGTSSNPIIRYITDEIPLTFSEKIIVLLNTD